MYSIYFITIIFILIICLILPNYISVENYDNINNPNCPYRYRSYWTTCRGDKNNRCKECGYMRPGLFWRIDDSDCCEFKCKRPQSQPINKDDSIYYCRDFNRCTPQRPNKYGERDCGINLLYNTRSKIYDTKEQCQHDIEPYKHLNRTQCLKTTGAGWCTNSNGDGVCLQGNPVGPTDLRNTDCHPNITTGINSWIPGNGDPFILQNFAY